MSMCRVFSCVVGKGRLLWPVHSLGKTLLAFDLLRFVLQGQICLLLHVSLDFLLLHSSKSNYPSTKNKLKKKTGFTWQVSSQQTQPSQGAREGRTYYLQQVKRLPGGFPDGSEVKASAWNAGDLGLIPGSGRSPWRRKWQPTPVLLPGESHGGRSLVGCHWQSRTWLSEFTLTFSQCSISPNRKLGKF